jgi:hypothetical protein
VDNSDVERLESRYGAILSGPDDPGKHSLKMADFGHFCPRKSPEWWSIPGLI